MNPRLLALLAALAITAVPAAGQTPPPAPAAPPQPARVTRLDLRIDPLVDLYFQARALATAEGEPAEPLAPAVTAVRELQASLGTDLLAWGIVDTAVAAVAARGAGAAGLAARVAELPESVTLPGGRQAPLRAGVAQLATALAAVEPAFRRDLWPARSARLAAVRERLAQELLPRWEEALAYHAASLDLRDPGGSVPAHLVIAMPWPAAVTQRDADGGGAIFVAVEAQAGSLLWEILLHEATHALDLATRGQQHALHRLRAALEAAGVGRRDRAWRDLPHTLMFVQAGETVRRRLDPGHRHYGEVDGYYDRVPHAAAERRLWTAYLDGAATLDATLARLVELARPAPAPPASS